MIHFNPFEIVLNKHVTEKSKVLENLQHKDSNPSLKRCDSPKYVFVVNRKANKHQIASAIEHIYAEKKIKVVAVNTINTKEKQRRVRGRIGYKSAFKKAIVTLLPGNSIDETN
jgi:large subunit ribosomal protein L23